MKKPPFISHTSLAVLATLAGALHSFAIEAVLTDDATVNRAIPHAAYYTQPTLAVAASVQGVADLSYLKFDLSSLPPETTGTQVIRATLEVYCDNITKSGTADIVAVTSPWVESIITGENPPALGPVVLAGTPLTLTDKRHWICFDVTPLVADWVDGSLSNNGLAIVPEYQLGVGGIAATFDSKENAATGHEAVLEIDLAGNGAPGAQGPTGEQGPNGPRRFDKPAEARKSDNLLILWADEAQRFVSASEEGMSDYNCIDVIREAQATVVAAAQSSTSFIPPLGREKARVFTLNLRNRLIFRAADEDGALESADFLGKRRAIKKSWGYSGGKMSRNYSEQDEHKIKSHDLRALPKHTAVVIHCERGHRRQLLPPLEPDGQISKWFGR